MKYLAGHRTIVTSLSALMLVTAPLYCNAEEIRIPLGQQNQTSQWQEEQPARGLTKRQVEARYGAPNSRHGPNGKPPIYYWEYPHYTVYFEGDHVLHAVAKQVKAAP